MSPRIDVIVPCYKYGHLLRECVRSVLDQQTGVHVRVIVIDDCSPDDTETIGRALANEDSRVEYIRHATNQGHLITFNEGLALATGDYTLLLSADDKVVPGTLRRAAQLLNAHPNVGFAYGHAVKFRGDEANAGAARETDDFPTRIIPGQQFIRDACATGDNIVLTPTVVVRTSLQHRLGGYLAPLTHSGDFEMWMRFAAHSDVGFIDGLQAFYRVHGANMSNGYSLLRDIEQRKLAFDELFKAHSSHIDSFAARRREAYRSLATTAFWVGAKLFDQRDIDGCRAFHALTLRIDPSFRLTPSWIKFQWTRAMGPGAGSAIRPLVMRLIGRPAT